MYREVLHSEPSLSLLTALAIVSSRRLCNAIHNDFNIEAISQPCLELESVDC